MSVPIANVSAVVATGPQTRSEAGNYVTRAGNGRGSLWLQSWRDHIIRTPDISPSLAKSAIMDDFKKKFATDYRNFADKPKLLDVR